MKSTSSPVEYKHKIKSRKMLRFNYSLDFSIDINLVKTEAIAQKDLLSKSLFHYYFIDWK